MANWVSASTTDYWKDSEGGVTYLGGGIWELGSGPGGMYFDESLTSPFLPDPYYYTSTTHYGVRFTLSWNPNISTNVLVQIFTNESGYDSYEQSINFPSGTTTNNSYLIEWPPAEAERIIQIQFIGDGGDFGSFYGSTPIVSGIEVDIEGGGEPETRCVLYKHTGFTEVVEVIDVPASPSGSYGTTGTTVQSGVRASPVSPLSGGMWGTPVRLGQPGVKRPIKKVTPKPGGGSSGGEENDWDGTSRTNATIVRGVDEDGNEGIRIYATDDDGNITSPISPFIPVDS